ncbi:MAG: DUF6062 family protein [Bacillota bacterium]
MKETIYSIPVTDLMRADAECPFCWWEEELTRNLLDVYMQGSLMEENWRDKVLEGGLCRRHLRELYRTQQKLSVAIITEALLTYELNLARKFRPPVPGKGSGFLHSKRPEGLADRLAQRGENCLACSDLERELIRSADNFWHLMKTEPDFVTLVRGSRGFCIPHFRLLWERGLAACGGAHYGRLMEPLLEWEFDLLEKADMRLKKFIRKFDYRFADTPMDEEKDALERGLNKLRGVRTGDGRGE